MSEPISRAEALRISQETLERAEAERTPPDMSEYKAPDMTALDVYRAVRWMSNRTKRSDVEDALLDCMDRLWHYELTDADRKALDEEKSDA